MPFKKGNGFGGNLRKGELDGIKRLRAAWERTLKKMGMEAVCDLMERNLREDFSRTVNALVRSYPKQVDLEGNIQHSFIDVLAEFAAARDKQRVEEQEQHTTH